MADRVKLPLLGCAACGLALAVLVVLAYGVGPAERLDASILIRAGGHFNSADGTANAFAALGDPAGLLAMLAMIVFLALSWGARREAIAAVVLVVGANVTTQILKALLAHPRYSLYSGFAGPWSDAFPSGHTTAAASAGLALVFASPPRLRPLAALAGGVYAVAMGATVVVLQWHFPSDVLGAYLVVAGWGFAILAALRLRRPPRPARPGRGNRPNRPAIDLP